MHRPPREIIANFGKFIKREKKHNCIFGINSSRGKEEF